MWTQRNTDTKGQRVRGKERDPGGGEDKQTGNGTEGETNTPTDRRKGKEKQTDKETI